MIVRTIIVLLMVTGLFTVFSINVLEGLKKIILWRPPKVKKKETAKEFVQRLQGKKKENFLKKNLEDTKDALKIIGQEDKYKKKTRLSLVCGVGGGIFALLVLKSPLLVLILGIGCAMIPLWLIQLNVYAYGMHVNNELQTALSLITNAYIRENDIVKAMSDAVPMASSPVKDICHQFVQTTKVNANIISAIERMQQKLDNPLFQQWCDILILCQDDHTLKAALLPIVDKFSELKADQAENETLMLKPLQDTLLMVGIVCASVPMLWGMNPTWYNYLVTTTAGQVTIAVVAIIIFASIHKSIKLSRPVEYKM